MKIRFGMLVLVGALFASVAPLDAAIAQGHGYGHGYGHGFGPGRAVGAIFGAAAAIVTAPFVIVGAIAQSVVPPPAYYPPGGGYAALGYDRGYYAVPSPPAYGGYYGRGYQPRAYGPPPEYGVPRNGYAGPRGYGPAPNQGYTGPRN